MIPKECKRLAEVDFPIAVVSKHSAREKSIRHGHPSTLHLWWARRPLAACRSMLLALLLPDPCDTHCPAEFKKQARKLLARVGGSIDVDDMGLREALLGFIGDFAAWDVSSSSTYLEISRGLVKAAHPHETPLVVDPFAGGGSIPLEALRLGCDAFASDLNPVACLINKVMLEDIPRYAKADFTVKDNNGQEIVVQGLANALRHVGTQIKKAAEKELAKFYPPDPDGARPIAYLWARTIRCEAPNCGAEIPLVRSFWLGKKTGRRRALRLTGMATTKHGLEPQFEIFEPKADKDVASGTVARAKATCLHCGTVMSPVRVRAQLTAQHGGADPVFDDKGNRVNGARLLAIVSTLPGGQGREYRTPNGRDTAAVFHAHGAAADLRTKTLADGLLAIPDEAIPTTEMRRISLPIYGMTRWRDTFTSRQLLALYTHFGQARANPNAPALNRIVALALSRSVNALNTICRWHLSGEKLEGAYSRQALGMVWDFCEGNPSSNSTGSFSGAIEWIAAVVEASASAHPGQVAQADAAHSPQTSEAATAWFTDPPYYDSVPYSHLSDFAYVWLRRLLGADPSLGFTNDLTPKQEECVVDRPHSANPQAKGREFYEAKMADAMREGRRVVAPEGIGSVVFAHKTTEGWESLLSGMIDGGWVITGSWPIATEMGERLNARDTASLATSVHLVCRPRPEDASVGDWGDVLRELPTRVGNWMERLQGEGVRGADLVFACIGPALEIFSRYSRVETADGREVKLAEFLAKVWEVVGRTALEQVLGTAEAKARNGAAGALEEDARLTALFLWTLQSTDTANGNGNTANADEEETEDEDDEEASPRGKKDGFTLIFDVVRRFAQPLGILLPKWEDRIIKTEKGIVRLLPVAERAMQLFGESSAQAVAAWIEEDPAKDIQPVLFPEMQAAQPAKARPRGKGKKPIMEASDLDIQTQKQATTLDRVHAAMLLQAGGQSNALRSLIQGEQQRGPDFLRLANALSALYPRVCEEKRLLDAMLLAVPR